MSAINYAGAGILPDMFTACTMLDVVTDSASDGKFGSRAHYADGATFYAYLRKDTSPEALVAERNGPHEQYTVVVGAGVTLKHGDVFRRESDGATFRVNGATVDGAAPAASTIQIAKTTAERWDPPA